MAKTTNARGRPKGPEKVTLYVEVPPEIKAEMERLAQVTRRSLTNEVIIALEQYIASKKGGA
jgi:hypothetical protein